MYEVFTMPAITNLFNSLTTDESPANLTKVKLLIAALNRHHDALDAILSDIDRYDTELVAKVINPIGSSAQAYQTKLDAYRQSNARRMEKASDNTQWILEQCKLEDLSGLLQLTVNSGQRGRLAELLGSLGRVLREGNARSRTNWASRLVIAMTIELQSERDLARSQSTPYPRKRAS